MIKAIPPGTHRKTEHIKKNKTRDRPVAASRFYDCSVVAVSLLPGSGAGRSAFFLIWFPMISDTSLIVIKARASTALIKRFSS